MLYSKGPPIDWTEIPRSAEIRLRPFRRVDLGEKVLLLSIDSPGWVCLSAAQVAGLSFLNGQTHASLERLLQNEKFRASLKSLYDGGLLVIGEHFGLRGRPELASSTQLSPAEPVPKGHNCGSGSGRLASVPSILLIKLTGSCNWACKYCYDYNAGRFRERVTLEQISGLLEEMAKQHQHIFLLFHGGEPLLCFPEIQRIVEFTERLCLERAVKAHFSLQTNGVLLDSERIAFLDHYSFDIGMSLDGPPHINDLTRVDHGNRGTSASIAELFQKYPDFLRTRVGFITTVTSANVEHLAETAEYLRSLGVRSWKTAIFDQEGRGAKFPELEPSVEVYTEFLKWAITRCASGAWSGFKMKTVLELVEVILSPERRNMCLKFPCGAGREFAVASADKQLMACDATYNSEFRLAPLDSGFAAAARSDNMRRLEGREHWLLTEAPCSTCPWLHYCAGTCMAKALIKHKTIKAVDDFECSVRLSAFPLLFDALTEPRSGLLTYYMESRS